VTREVLVDARWLEPPEPMERILTALDLLRAGQYIRFLIHREPLPLYAILTERGYGCRTLPMADGCFELLIERLPGPG
jgi:uncharacterized protein (DUF2249 family)